MLSSPNSRSEISLLYNDHAVQENHHVSAVFRLLQTNEEANILSNLSKDDWRSEQEVFPSCFCSTVEPVEEFCCSCG